MDERFSSVIFLGNSILFFVSFSLGLDMSMSDSFFLAFPSSLSSLLILCLSMVRSILLYLFSISSPASFLPSFPSFSLGLQTLIRQVIRVTTGHYARLLHTQVMNMRA